MEETPESQTEPQTLTYAKAPPSRGRTARRWAIRIAALVIVAVIGARFGPPLSRHATALVLQHRALGHSAPADFVVLTKTETTNAPGHMHQSPGTRTFHIKSASPSPWARLVEQADLPQNPVLFLGKRTSPSGNERLVYLHIAGSFSSGVPAPAAGNMGVPVAARVYDRAGWSKGLAPRGPAPVAAQITLASVETVKVLAGQADPSDPSHVTVECRAPGVIETIDFWLQDDDTVRIAPRNPSIPTGTITPF